MHSVTAIRGERFTQQHVIPDSRPLKVARRPSGNLTMGSSGLRKCVALEMAEFLVTVQRDLPRLREDAVAGATDRRAGG